MQFLSTSPIGSEAVGTIVDRVRETAQEFEAASQGEPNIVVLDDADQFFAADPLARLDLRSLTVRGELDASRFAEVTRETLTKGEALDPLAGLMCSCRCASSPQGEWGDVSGGVYVGPRTEGMSFSCIFGGSRITGDPELSLRYQQHLVEALELPIELRRPIDPSGVALGWDAVHRQGAAVAVVAAGDIACDLPGVSIDGVMSTVEAFLNLFKGRRSSAAWSVVGDGLGSESIRRIYDSVSRAELRAKRYGLHLTIGRGEIGNTVDALQQLCGPKHHALITLCGGVFKGKPVRISVLTRSDGHRVVADVLRGKDVPAELSGALGLTFERSKKEWE